MKNKSTFCELEIGYDILHYSPEIPVAHVGDRNHPEYANPGSGEECEFEVFVISRKKAFMGTIEEIERITIPDGRLKALVCSEISDVVFEDAREQHQNKILDAQIDDYEQKNMMGGE
jgi:hypothetical protein